MSSPKRIRTERKAWLLWAALALTACGGHPTSDAYVAADGPPRVLVISALDGYVEPCGCTVDLLLGGIDRIARVVADERQKGPTAVVVVGPHLFGGPVDEHLVGQEEAKAHLIAQSLAAIGVDAAVPTAADLARGADFYAKLHEDYPLPDVTANVANGGGRTVDLGRLRVGFFGLVDPAAPPGPRGPATDPAKAATEAAAALRAKGATVVIALGSLPRPELRKLATSVPGVDLWVLGEGPAEEALASPAGNTFVVEAGDRGRNLGRIVLQDASEPGPLADPAGERARALKALTLQIKMRSDLFTRMHTPELEQAIAGLEKQKADLEKQPLATTGKRFEYTLLPVAKTVEPDPKVKDWLAAYNQQLKAINLAQAGEVVALAEGESGYSGAKACADCHEDAYDFWQTTPHSHAWQTLVQADKTFDAECVACHVTGWQKPGGSALGHLDALQNVQCEVCHGPGSIHVDRGGGEETVKRAVPETVCVGCHSHEHSPKFDYAAYLPKIIGPGHGKPVKKLTGPK
jgi:2',3'-cyclic-nucleotide 2'-phosphodiesterase (5'-nucleotidase family)